MAKSKETYNKKEKEKKRLKQQQEKRQKMELRKGSSKNGNSMEGMIAYLDENGNLTDQPPDPRKKQVYVLEDIQISVPKQTEIKADEMQTGVVSFYNEEKGFGFIIDNANKERIFFHRNEMMEALVESDKVKYFIEKGPRGLSALQVGKI